MLWLPGRTELLTPYSQEQHCYAGVMIVKDGSGIGKEAYILSSNVIKMMSKQGVIPPEISLED